MIDPRYMTAKEWCAQVAVTLSTYGKVPELLDESDWPTWAAIVITIPKVAATAPPDPRFFSDWRDWAFRFNQDFPL